MKRKEEEFIKGRLVGFKAAGGRTWGRDRLADRRRSVLFDGLIFYAWTRLPYNMSSGTCSSWPAAPATAWLFTGMWRRLKGGPLKQRVSPEEYIALLNEELKRHPGREEGMEFVPAPEGARGEEIAGYTLRKMNGRKDVFAAVSQKIFLQYRIR